MEVCWRCDLRKNRPAGQGLRYENYRFLYRRPLVAYRSMWGSLFHFWRKSRQRSLVLLRLGSRLTRKGFAVRKQRQSIFGVTPVLFGAELIRSFHFTPRAAAKADGLQVDRWCFQCLSARSPAPARVAKLRTAPRQQHGKTALLRRFCQASARKSDRGKS